VTAPIPLPGTVREVLEHAERQDLKSVIVIMVPKDEDGDATISWSNLKLTDLCYLEKLLSELVRRRLYAEGDL